MATSTQFVWNRIAFKKNMKNLNDAFIAGQRAEMQIFANMIKEGYEKIVANWTNKPAFRTHVMYRKSTKRFFVRVQIIGTPITPKEGEKTGGADTADRFRAIDYGLRRADKVDAKGNLVPNKVKLKFSPRTEIPRGVQGRRTGTGTMSQREYGEYMKGLIKEYTKYVTPRGMVVDDPKKARLMPMRYHDPRTGKGGHIGGSGQYYPRTKIKGGAEWKNIGYMNEVVLGDIEARYWTQGLRMLLKEGANVAGVARIWPSNIRTFSYWVGRGYRQGIRRGKASKG